MMFMRPHYLSNSFIASAFTLVTAFLRLYVYDCLESHAACNSESCRYRRQYACNSLKNEFPSFLFHSYKCKLEG